jgi:hypothetical protein
MTRRAAAAPALSRLLGAGGEIEVALARQRLLERLAASTGALRAHQPRGPVARAAAAERAGHVHERPNWKAAREPHLAEITSDAAIGAC